MASQLFRGVVEESRVLGLENSISGKGPLAVLPRSNRLCWFRRD